MAFYFRGRSLKRMSREFETPIGTIKRHLHVARNRRRRAMEEAAGTATAEVPANHVGAPRRPRRRRELACV